jgi:hypothetical protein
MHDDDNRFQRFVPLLRRVIILLAVLAATPVVLWMITTFVRAYVGPPRIPAAHQIAATAPTVSAASISSSDQANAAPAQSKMADITASTTDVTATTSDARDVPLPKGALLTDRPSDGAAAGPAGIATIAPASIPSPSQAHEFDDRDDIDRQRPSDSATALGGYRDGRSVASARNCRTIARCDAPCPAVDG